MENTNPYLHEEIALAPFAGRQAALLRLDHYLKEPVSTSALIFMSRRWQGKTALLRHFAARYDDNFINVYLPLKQLNLSQEDRLFDAIIEGTGRSVAQRDITLTRLPAAEQSEQEMRRWLDETWLPGVAQVIRPHRKLVLLLDDADELLRASDAKYLENDFFGFVHSLMRQHSQLKLVMSFPTEREEDLTRLGPLFDNNHLMRLNNLSQEESIWLLQAPPADEYRLNDDAAQWIFQAAGGYPLFLQRYGYQLYQYDEEHPEAQIITVENAKSLLPAVQQESSGQFTHFWNDSSDNEQLLLLTISKLRYEDPLSPLSVDRLTEWLIETEYPLDQTAVNAVLRSLEYRELIYNRPGGIELSSSMFQTWLLSRAEQSVSGPAAESQTFRSPTLLLILLIIVLALFLLVNLSNSPQEANQIDPQPTVTLATGE